MAISRIRWRSNWLRCIAELTSIEYQQKNWLNPGNRNPHFSFNEFICQYFDDLPLNEFNSYSRYIIDSFISQEEYEAIKDWHLMLENYVSQEKEGRSGKEILNDLGWITTVKTGHEAKVKLKSLILPEEVRYLVLQE